jgi:hypothetical protein
MAGFGALGSVDTSPEEMAGFGALGSVDTSPALAALDARDGRRPRPLTASPAAFKYAPAVSRRTDVACSICLSDQPSRPSATTCCFFASLKTLLIPAHEHLPRAFVNVSAAPA